MKTEYTGTLYVCDACGKEVVTRDEEPPDGFQGYMIHTGGHGGYSFEYFACRKNCVTKAMWNAQDRVLDRQEMVAAGQQAARQVAEPAEEAS